MPVPPLSAPWLIRVPEIFGDVVPELVHQLESPSSTKLGHEYHLVRPADPAALRRSATALFIRWNMPVQHSWPCRPRRQTLRSHKARPYLRGGVRVATP